MAGEKRRGDQGRRPSRDRARGRGTGRRPQAQEGHRRRPRADPRPPTRGDRRSAPRRRDGRGRAGAARPLGRGARAGAAGGRHDRRHPPRGGGGGREAPARHRGGPDHPAHLHPARGGAGHAPARGGRRRAPRRRRGRGRRPRLRAVRPGRRVTRTTHEQPTEGNREMPTSVISAFDSETAGKVVEELVRAGFPERDVAILEGGEDEIVGEIVPRGFGRDDAREFAEAAGRGRKLVAAEVPEAKVDRAVEIMDRYESGGNDKERGAGREEAVPVVEEELSVGKRRVATGGVRVTSRVVERPVQKTVHLREEHVEAERKRSDRVLSPEETEAAFRDKTVEVTGTAEEAEVRKTARAVGEVSLGKRVEEHAETVRDKVRPTEVEVEQIEPASSKRG